MPNLGGPELFWILIIVVVLFGASKIPQIMKGLGQGIREFKREMHKPLDEEPTTQASASKTETTAAGEKGSSA